MQLLNTLRKYDNKTSLKKDPLLEVENILSQLDNSDKELLAKAGFRKSIEEYQNIKDANSRFANTAKIIEKYGKENIFKTSSIKRLCKNYGLRFLPTVHYKGNVPKILGTKIKEFTVKIPNGMQLLEKSYILAPKTSFKLNPIPKDPLYFVRLTNNAEGEENLWYLVHQWGGEINWFRYIVNIPFRTWYGLVFTVLLGITMLTYSGIKLNWFSNEEKMGYFIMSIFGYFGLVAWLVIALIHNKSNKTAWNSTFK
jgi:hypothetical protein